MGTIRDSATVIVSETVKGTRKGRGPDKPNANRKLDSHTRVNPILWAEARKLVRKGERFVPVSTTEVVTVYDKHD